MTIEILRREEVCANCINYHAHYTTGVLDGKIHSTIVNCGHCHYPRIKHRAPGTAACKHFENVREVL